MMPQQEESLEQEIWRKAISMCEREVMSACPVLIGGRREKECVENYAHRCIVGIGIALGRLSEARDKYAILNMEVPDANRK